MDLFHTVDLAALLSTAATLDPADREAGARLRRDAHRVTARLVGAGRLPHHLVVELDDPPVVVVRALAAAWRMNGAATGKDEAGEVGAAA